MYEVLPPDFELIRIMTAVAMLREVHAEPVVRGLGQMQIGCLAFSPHFNSSGEPTDEGTLNLGTVIPLTLLDLTQPEKFLLYLAILAKGADGLEAQLEDPSRPDRF